MANIVLMPQLGISEESAVLSQWRVAEGDVVKAGQILFTLETGKSSFDVESEFDGTVLKLLCDEGDELPIKAPICVIGEPGETVDVPGAAAAPAAAEEAAPAVEEKVAAPIAAPVATVAADDKLYISPRARNLAEKTGADLSAVTATGPEGRIIERDVVRALNEGKIGKAAPAAAEEKPAAPAPAAETKAAYTVEPLTRVRKVIADNMHRSLSEMAQLTLTTSFDATALLDFRKAAKSGKIAGLEGVTYNDMILFAVSRTLLDFPYFNAHFTGDEFHLYNTVNLGFACDTDKGLMVPVIKNAETLSLKALSERAKTLAKSAQSGSIAPADMQEGTFTVSNLGSLGIESFTPVINPPQTGILGVNTLETRVRLENGNPVYYTAMGLSLTFDHRAVDGAPAARFLAALRANLENFTLLLAK
ncbi:MAG: 2-oxo acid dehydrogenase subunit E2 [Clostridia bacterium]|nr:2-oxo acid dehydrogenase subunit E2 [Clostridia bacterium]